MVDRIPPERRSWLMSRVRSKDTSPEMAVRRLTHSMGYRYRLHGKDLPGSPDLVFPSRKAVIFVHGCFWHRHDGCKKATTPKTRNEYWANKFELNVSRDARAISDLEIKGWKALIIWECETRNLEYLSLKIKKFLDEPTPG